MLLPAVLVDINDPTADGFYWSTTIPSQNEYETRCSSIRKGGVFSPGQSHLNLPSVRQLRITDSGHRILRRLTSHPQIRIQLIQIPHSLTSPMQLIPSISNQHSHPDKRNGFSWDSSNAFGSYSLGSRGEAVAESSGGCFTVDGGGLVIFDGLILTGEFGLHHA
jgi:hypothetical protein